MPEKPLLSNKVLLSRKEFSSLTSPSLRTTASLLASGDLRSIRVGRRRLIPRTELERFAKRDHPALSVQRKKVDR
jgi:excisionase family DNA binding protein